MKQYIDSGSFVVALITFVLFVAALFVKGITHDLFIEAGVFLVSVKIILMAYKNNILIGRLEAKMDALEQALKATKGNR